jgi:hypothetical protein
LHLSEADLKVLGIAGKDRKEDEDEAEVQKLREKHHVG